MRVAFTNNNIYTKDPSVLHWRMCRLNPELISEEWGILQKFVEPHSIRWIFEIDLDTVNDIRKAGFCAFAALEWGAFKILKDPNQKPLVVTTTKSGVQNAETPVPPIEEMHHLLIKVRRWVKNSRWRRSRNCCKLMPRSVLARPMSHTCEQLEIWVWYYITQYYHQAWFSIEYGSDRVKVTGEG